MVTQDQTLLDERLKSLKIDRKPIAPNKKKGGRPIKSFLALSILLALLGVGYIYFTSSPKPVTAAEVKVETGAGPAGQTVLTASGYVVAHHKIAVGAKVMGRVKWIGVEKGDKVQQGQVLVRLEDEEYQAQVNQAKANLGAAQANLDKLRAGSRDQEKLQAKASVDQAEANLKNAEADYDRAERLSQAGVQSKADLDHARMSRDVARAQLENARQGNSLMVVGPRIEDIHAGEAQVAQMKAALDYAGTQLAATEIKAPVSGTVLERLIERGEMVSPSAFGGDAGARTSVVSLADLSDLQIELDISQTDFARLKLNQRAEITPEAYANLRYSGFIAEIAPQANRAKSTVQIKVKVDNPDGQLRPDMNARVNFLSDAAPTDNKTTVGRVLVPQAAIVKKGESDFVFIVKGARVEQRVIRKGDLVGESYTVLDGLSGGELVVTSGADKLGDGDKVTVSKR